MCCFFFNDTATTEIYTLSLHDALPIYACPFTGTDVHCVTPNRVPDNAGSGCPNNIVNIHEIAALSAIFEYMNGTMLFRSEEHTPELQPPDHLLCRLLLDNKTPQTPPFC